MAFIFPLKLGNLAILVFKNYGTHERKVRQSVFVSVEINSTIAKLTVRIIGEQISFGLKPQNLHALRHQPWNYYTRFFGACVLARNQPLTFVHLLPLAEKTEN